MVIHVWPRAVQAALYRRRTQQRGARRPFVALRRPHSGEQRILRSTCADCIGARGHKQSSGHRILLPFERRQ